MTKLNQVAFIGLVVAGFVFQSVSYAEEVGQPFRFSIGVSAEFTDNRDAVELNEQDNVDFRISPRLDYIYSGEAGSLNLFYLPSYRYRTEAGDTGDDTLWEHDFGLKIKRSISERTRLSLNEKFDYTDYPQIENGGIAVRGDHTYIANTIKASLNTDLLRHSNLDLAIENHLKSFDDDAIAKTSDEGSTTLNAVHRYQINQTLRSVLGASYIMYTYDNSLNRDFDSIIAKVGLENSFTPTTLGVLTVGLQTRDFDDSDMDVDDEPYLLASLENKTGSDLTLGASVGHGVRDTDSFPFSSQIYTELRGFGHLYLAPEIVLSAVFTYRMSEYDEDTIPANVVAEDFLFDTNGDETTIVGDLNLAFNMIHNVSMFVGYRYEDIDSDVAQSYSKNTGRIGASLNF